MDDTLAFVGREDAFSEDVGLFPTPEDLMEGHAATFLEACSLAIGEPPRPRLPAKNEMHYLLPVPPKWVTESESEPFSGYFEDRQRVLREGHLVWAAIVQANTMLFDPGPHDHPAEVVYTLDPGQVEDPARLLQVAERIYALKETAPEDEELARLAHHLTVETERLFGQPIVPWLSNGMDLELSSVMVHRKHLPSGFLRRSVFPILVAPDPRWVMVLPERYWPTGLVDWWAEGRAGSSDGESGPRWLASLVGALYDGARVDVVIDTDQVLVLHGLHSREAAPARLRELRSADRAVLVAADPRNRRLAVSEIVRVTMPKQNRLTHREKVPGKVRIFMADGDQVELCLEAASPMESARRVYSQMFGSRFEG